MSTLRTIGGDVRQEAMTLSIATFKNCRDNQPRQRQTTWEELSVVLMRHAEREEKDGPLWSPTLYKPGTTRAKANVVEVTCLVLDFDNGAGPEDFIRPFRGFAAAMHTTFQHLPEAQRWRVVLPLLTPVPAAEWPHVWEQMTRHFGGSAIDPSCKDASRIYYTPSCPPGAERDAMAQDGEWLNPAGFARPSVPLLVTRAMGHLGEGRNNAGMWLACQLRDNGYTQGEAERADWHRHVGREKVRPDGRVDVYDADEWQENVRKVYATPAREPWKPSTNGTHSGPNGTSVASVAETRGTSVASVAGFSPRETRPQPPEDLAPEALHGLPGEIVQTIDPHTESSQAAVLASFLVGVGCLLGKGPHVFRDGRNHAANEFACLVGLSSVGRKGTATSRTDEVFKCLYDTKYTTSTFMSPHEDRASYSDLVIRGLGSGEALIETLADPNEDRRRVVFEEEFARVIKVMRREGSTLSDTIRAAWDGGVLANRTKGKHLQAKDHHVSILGHITEAELRTVLSSTEVFNGFANRFLWFCTKRSKLLPFGGGDVPLNEVVKQLHEVIEYSSVIGRVEFDEQCAWAWDNEGGGLYRMLTERPEGLWGAVTSRAAPHVLRLALMYTVLDAEKIIRAPHLLAALAVWDYNEKSCAYIFGTSTGDDMADQIEELLQEAYPGYLTRKEIRDAFSRHAKPGSIPRGLEVLAKHGRAEQRQVPTDGRYAEAWAATEQKGRDRCDRSPLERAKELLS
jgi:hypothetical protein